MNFQSSMFNSQGRSLAAPLMLPPQHGRYDRSQSPSAAVLYPYGRKAGDASSNPGWCQNSGLTSGHTPGCNVASRTSFRRGEAEECRLPLPPPSLSQATPEVSPQGSLQKSSPAELDRFSWFLMVIDNLDFQRIPFLPSENNTPLLVDSDTPPARKITRKLLKPVAGRKSQIAEFLCIVKLDQPPSSPYLNVRRNFSAPSPAENFLSIPAGKGSDHPQMLPQTVSRATRFFQPVFQPVFLRV